MAFETKRQLDLLRFIAGFEEAVGFAPTYNEMMRGLNATSKANIARLIERLELRGCIERRRMEARAIETLVTPSIPRAPDGAPLYFVPVKALRDPAKDRVAQ